MFVHTINTIASQKTCQKSRNVNCIVCLVIKLPEPLRCGIWVWHYPLDGNHPSFWLCTGISVCAINTSQKHGQKHRNMSCTVTNEITQRLLLEELPEPFRSAKRTLHTSGNGKRPAGGLCTNISVCTINTSQKHRNMSRTAPKKFSGSPPVNHPVWTASNRPEPSGRAGVYRYFRLYN